MKKLIALPIFAIALAQSPSKLAGVWEWVNTQHAGGAPDLVRIKIEREGQAIRITFRSFSHGGVEETSNRFVPGQETKGEMHGAPLISQTDWDGPALVIHSAAMLAGQELKLTEHYQVSLEGTGLTLSEEHRYGSEPAGKSVRLFARKPDSDWETGESDKPSEHVYKNIQILKGVPASQLPRVMAAFTRGLGVECSYCHVAGHFEGDEKPAKATAREMFSMVASLNQLSPKMKAVTCWTCHRGSLQPENERK